MKMVHAKSLGLQKDQSQQQKQQQQRQQHFYSPALKMQQESSVSDSAVPLHLPMPLPIYSIATTALSTTSSVPASVIVSSSVGTALQPPARQELSQNHNLLPVDSKVPQFSTGPSQQALACQVDLTCLQIPKVALLLACSPALLTSSCLTLSALLLNFPFTYLALPCPARSQCRTQRMNGKEGNISLSV